MRHTLIDAHTIKELRARCADLARARVSDRALITAQRTQIVRQARLIARLERNQGKPRGPAKSAPLKP